MSKEETIKRLKELDFIPVARRIRQNDFIKLQHDLNYLETGPFKNSLVAQEVISLIKNHLRKEKLKQYD